MYMSTHACADPESFFRGIPILTMIVFVSFKLMRAEDPHTIISGPSSSRQQKAI